jgi:hypothetical protein
LLLPFHKPHINFYKSTLRKTWGNRNGHIKLANLRDG